MKNRISFNCSNLVATQTGHRPANRWEQCVEDVSAFYAPAVTFPERFGRMVADIKALGFDALDIWTPGQLNWRWTTSEHIAAANRILDQNQMAVTSLGGDFGETREEFLAACELANGLGVDLLSGGCPLFFTDRAFVVDALQQYDLRLSIENHPETTAQETLDEIGTDHPGRIGTTVDTGWYATRGFDVVRAITELGCRIMHVHLKNVLPGEEHLNVGYTQGCVPMEECVRTLKRIGYAGDCSMEDHAIDHDPTQEIIEARGLLQRWLSE
ncbi:MAG: sugar phosphate isomerase/epimerase [Anaerolineae bacterium]